MTSTRSASATTVPEHSPDRRTLLGGVGSVTMAAMVAASTEPASASAKDVEAQLIAGLAALDDLEGAHADAVDAYLAAKDAYDAGRPPRPIEQRWSLRSSFRHGETVYVEPDGMSLSFIPDSDVELLRSNVQPSTGYPISDGDLLLPHGGYTLPVSEEAKRLWAEQDKMGRAAAARVLAAYDAWRAECKAYAERVGLTVAQTALIAARTASQREIARLLSLPTTTLRGFACKARILTLCREDDDDVECLLEELAALVPHPFGDEVSA